MSTEGKAALAVIIFFIILIAAWLLWPAGKDEIDLPEKRFGPDSASSMVISDIDESGLVERDDVVPPFDQSPERQIVSPKQTEPLDPDEGLLKILVIHQETGNPVKGAELSLESRHTSREEQERFLRALQAGQWYDMLHIGEWEIAASAGERSFTDAHGRSSIRLPAGTPFKIQVTGEDFARAIKEMEALVPGERREAVLEVFPIIFYGKVVEKGPGERPIEGARARQGRDGMKVATSGSDGMFRLFAGSKGQEYVEVGAEGFGLVLARLTTNHDTPVKACLIGLDRAAALHGFVHGPSGLAQGAVVTCETDGYRAWQGDNCMVAEHREWKTATDGSGSFRLASLPPLMELRVKISLDGKEPLRMPELFVLKPGEERRADWHLGGLTTLRGRVVDQNGSVVAGVKVVAVMPEYPEDTLRKFSKTQSFYLNDYYAHKLGMSYTDENGTFVLPDLIPGKVLVGVQPESDDSLYEIEENVYVIEEDVEEASTAVSGTGRMIQIPGNTAEMEITLTVYRGLYIRGKVMVPGGEDPWGIHVHARSPDYVGKPEGETDGDGFFRVGPLLPGKYRLHAGSYFGYSDSRPVMADAGDEHVVLHLAAGGTLKGRITGRPGVDLRTVNLTATHRENRSSISRLAEADGTFEIPDLEPGTYDIFAHYKDRYAGVYLGATVLAGKDSPVLNISLCPAATLTVMVNASIDTISAFIEMQGAAIQEERIETGKPGRNFTVPPGRLRVVLRAFSQDLSAGQKVIAAKEVDIKAGECQDVVFEIK